MAKQNKRNIKSNRKALKAKNKRNNSFNFSHFTPNNTYIHPDMEMYMNDTKGFYEKNSFGDITHADGSKDYANVRGGYISIKRPSVVKFVEDILSKPFLGWGYMETLNKGLSDGIITEEEHSLIMEILD